MAIQRVENINPNVLRQCREQIGLSVEEAEKKAQLSSLAKIEAGEKYPTVNQIERLAERYHVPIWVFLKEKLPDKYRFDTLASFRRFKNNPIMDNYKIKSVIGNVERFRELLLDIRDDMKEPVPSFSPPPVSDNFKNLARSIREWLGCTKRAYTFKEWREMVENNNVFVFATSKYQSWSKVEPDKFRGLAIYYDTLPIIIINNSDSHKAQSFTLFHELGHLLKKQSVLDEQKDIEMQSDEEEWCNRLAGEVLMPEDDFSQEVVTFPHNESSEEQTEYISKLAKKFKVSDYACLVRIRQLGVINQSEYYELETQLKQNYRIAQENLKQQKTPIIRNIAKEALEQYGNIYSKAVVQIYQDKEIELHKLCKLFGLKRASDALELETML